MSRLPAEIAIIDIAWQLERVDRRGHRHPLSSPPLLWGTWQDARPQTAHLWPAWSPDGSMLSTFVKGAEGPPHVHLHHADGIRQEILAEMSGRIPVTQAWSPSGDHLAVLSQREDLLTLSVLGPGRSRELVLAQGSPLYYHWMGEQLAAFVASGPDGTGGQIRLIDPGRGTHILPGDPGNFCVPVPAAGYLYYVSLHDPVPRLVRVDPSRPRLVTVDEVDGLVAAVADPSGQRLAVAVAPDGDGSPYRDLVVYDARSARRLWTADVPCLAFLWLGEDLLLAQVDSTNGRVRWLRVGADRAPEPIVTISPSRDLSFFLRFFEQFVLAHDLVDPTGRHLVLSGALDGHESSEPHAWVVPLDGGVPTDLGPAHFACWGRG